MKIIKQIINAENIWQTCVVVTDENKILYYSLKEGETVIEAPSPQWKGFGDDPTGLIKAKWNIETETWEECATEEEIAQWEEKQAEFLAENPVMADEQSTEDMLIETVVELSAKVEELEGRL